VEPAPDPRGTAKRIKIAEHPHAIDQDDVGPGRSDRVKARE
jgi:hypothetical protein